MGKHDYVFLCQQLRHLLKSAAAGVPIDEFWNVEDNIKALRKTKYSLLEDYFKEEEAPQIDRVTGEPLYVCPLRSLSKNHY